MATPANTHNMIACQCRRCGGAFDYDAKAVARGRGQFCSTKCSVENSRAVRWSEDPAARLRRRFEEKVIRRGTDECWGWIGFKHKGYGRVRVGPRAVGAHRIAYELYIAPITDGLTVLHKCDNPECTNPKHLRLGTNADNNLDRDTKGRVAVGERSSSAKLTEAAVREIRLVRPLTKVERANLATRFGVTEHTIYLAAKGKTWEHVQ